MINIKKKFNSFIKYFKYLIKKTLLKHPNKTKNIFTNKFKFKISNFNIYLISLIALLFIYLFYLSIPAYYTKSWVQNTIEDKLLNEFKMNFSISSEISYEVLPSPHFVINNAKIINDNFKNPKELSEIKELKVFVSQKNLYNKKKLKIKSVLINKANFLINPNDFSYFDKLFNNKFSDKKINIKNSNIFVKDVAGETVSITQISKSFIFYDELKLLNKIFLKGEVFKIPFILEIDKDLIGKENNTIIDSKKLKIKFKKNSIKKNEIINGLNNLSIFNSKLMTKYNLKDELLSFKSLNSQVLNSKIDYEGKLNLKPFNLIIDVSSQKINIKKLFKNSSILLELIKSKKLFHENLNITTSLNSSNITNSNILDSIKINFNAINGEIDLNKSYILSNKIGLLKSDQSRLFIDNDNLFFNGNFDLNVNNSNYFFSFFQTPKKYRKPIKNISFDLNFNFFKNKLTIKDFKIDKKKPNDGVIDILDDFNLDANQQISNLIVFKNLVNNLFSVYEG